MSILSPSFKEGLKVRLVVPFTLVWRQTLVCAVVIPNTPGFEPTHFV